jgi:hypothetical protein
MFIIINTPKSSYNKLVSNPSMAFLQAFTNTSNKGTMMGKLKTGINKWLLLALEAMAESMVNVEEKPTLPSKTHIE